MSAASNFSRITSRSPPSRKFSVANPFVWYIGARHEDDLRPSHRCQFDMNGSDSAGNHIAGRALMMTFGVPVAPLLQIPLICGGT